jgi:uncharacterized protein (DUF3084 family)
MTTMMMITTITISALLLFLKVSLVFFSIFNFRHFFLIVASVSPAEKRLKKAEEERDEAKLERDEAKRELDKAKRKRDELTKREINDVSFEKAGLEKVEEEIKRLSASFDTVNNVYLECLKSVNNCNVVQNSSSPSKTTTAVVDINSPTAVVKYILTELRKHGITPKEEKQRGVYAGANDSLRGNLAIRLAIVKRL